MAATATAPTLCEEPAATRRERRPCTGPRGITLGQLLARAHEGARAGAATGCPMCGDALEAHGLGSRCNDCGSQLV